MHIPLKILLTYYLLFSMCKPLYGECWIYKSSGVKRNDNYSFHIAKMNDVEISAVFPLLHDTPGVFDNKLPIYQVDEIKVQIIESKNTILL